MCVGTAWITLNGKVPARRLAIRPDIDRFPILLAPGSGGIRQPDPYPPFASPAMLLFFLDRYHLGDPLFGGRLARDIKLLAQPRMIVHGSGEEAERMLEAQGLIPERREGVLAVSDDRQRQLVVNAVRDLNRKLSAALDDEAVPSVRVLGTDRGLLRVEDGRLAAGRVSWLRDLGASRVVPVVGTVATNAGGQAVEVDAARAAAVLAIALDAAIVFLALGHRDGLYESEEPLSEVSVDRLADFPALPEPASIQTAVETGARVIVTSLTALRGSEVVSGTRIVPVGGR
jgi:acetylglutamate kinase